METFVGFVLGALFSGGAIFVFLHRSEKKAWGEVAFLKGALEALEKHQKAEDLRWQEEKKTWEEARRMWEEERGALLERAARLEAEHRALQERFAAQGEEHAQMGEAFQLKFEALANRIFEEKSLVFKKQAEDGMEGMLTPLRERLQGLQKTVEETFLAHNKEQFSLKNEIKRIVLANERITLQAENLTSALKGNRKLQGNWGEIMLEKILEDSGLRKGEDYRFQAEEMGLKGEDGRHQRPDVVVLLPENKHVIIDSKVSLLHYEQLFSEENPDVRAQALKLFLGSLRAHISGLEHKRYQDNAHLGTPDFVLMFVPIEGAYALAVQEDPTLHAHAWDKKIVLVCPATLFATLKTVASVWRVELQNRHTLEIARQGGALYDKIAGFIEDMVLLGDRMSMAQRAYGAALNKLSTGQGNILKRTENLKKLGVKTQKKLPSLTVKTEETEDGLGACSSEEA